MVLAVPPEHWPELAGALRREHVEATDLGEFVDTGRLTLRYHGEVVADLSMEFLHEGRPAVVRDGDVHAPARASRSTCPRQTDFTADLLALLRHWDVCSKEWIVRQYDHEVQARTVIKPLVGVRDDGPGDASVVLPVRGSTRGLAVACGINPRYGRLDPYAMAGCVIDEAIRNCVAVGADPDRIALLDNFCWGNTERPETLGSLVLAAQACHDLALAYGTPFISGKDSLNNEYTHEGQSLAIPADAPDQRHRPGARRPPLRDDGPEGAGQPVLLLAGHDPATSWAARSGRLIQGQDGGSVPRVDPELGQALFRAVHAAISRGLVRSCHDLSEGGLAVALAEMALAGGLGAEVSLRDVPLRGRRGPRRRPAVLRIALAVPARSPRPSTVAALADLSAACPLGRLGEVGRAGRRRGSPRLADPGWTARPSIDAPLDRL